MSSAYLALLNIIFAVCALVFFWFVLWRQFAVEFMRHRLRVSLVSLRNRVSDLDDETQGASQEIRDSLEDCLVYAIRRPNDLGVWRMEARRLLVRLAGINKCFNCARVRIARVEDATAKEVYLDVYRQFALSVIVFQCMTSMGFLLKCAVDFVHFTFDSLKDDEFREAIARAHDEVAEKRISDVDREAGCTLVLA